MVISKEVAAVIAFSVNAVIMAIVFIGVGIHSTKRTEPMNFWAGTNVPASKIKDVKAYNKENGIMWIVFGCLFILDGLLGLISVKVAAGLLVFLCVACVPVLLYWHTCIFKKYVVR